MPTKVNRRGQITIPKAIRDHLRIGLGTEVEFKVMADGKIVLTRVDALPPTSRLAAMGDLDISTEEFMALIRRGGDA